MIIFEEIFAGLQVTLIGMLVVFVALTLLIFCTAFMNNIIERFTKKPAPAPVAAPIMEIAPPAVEDEIVKDDDSLIAVITAAIAAAWQSEGGTAAPAFAVKQIRKIGSASTAWGKSGREESIYSRL